MHRRAALITAIAVASALRGGSGPQAVRRIAVSNGVQRAEVDALIDAARDCVGVSYASTRIDSARRCAFFESLDDIEPLIEYWESVRFSYAAFESGQKSGSAEVYTTSRYYHQMLG